MNKLILLLCTLAFGFSAGAQTVKMKKAIKEGDDEIAKYAEKFNKECGAHIKVTSKHADAAAIKVEGRDPENIVAVAGKQCGSILYHMGEICNRDADYKAELAKITSLTCTYKMMEKRPYWTFTKSGTALNATLHPTTDGSSEGMTQLKDIL